eukprot:Pompholyxophrys_sp_v1_NODE_122_length_1766_cov_2.347165.p2 type:complete len:131 gc:universal NODE_122_length_1766_cov_2.347165:1500-1108(-)
MKRFCFVWVIAELVLLTCRLKRHWLLIDCDLSKEVYNKIRQNALRHSVFLYPTYDHVREEKKQTYPSVETVTATSASTTLQSLLDVTTQRLCSYLDQVIDSNQFLFTSKWGFDGAAGQSMHKQIWGDTVD